MSARDDGGQAFPGQLEYDDRVESWDGVTLRDYFAAKAIPVAAKACVDSGMSVSSIEGMKLIANISYGIADAMLAERAK